MVASSSSASLKICENAYNANFDLILLKQIFIKAKTTQNAATLIQIVASITANYKKNDQPNIQELFLPAIQELTILKNSSLSLITWS